MMNRPIPKIPPRDRHSHKGDFGKVLVIGGSRGMAGAISLTGQAALRGGAGLVTVATSSECLETVAGFSPCYMTIGLSSDRQGRLMLPAVDELAKLIEKVDCLAIGPGLGRSCALDRIVESLFESPSKPVVLDADALNALAANPGALYRAGGPRVLTPHPGEFRRLVVGLEQTGLDLPGEDPAAAEEIARNLGLTIVLKGHRTLVTDGQRSYTNQTGNPGMATGGSGDVLTGLITALVGQGLAVFEAAQLGVYLHGLSGDLAAERLGETGLVATDLIDFLPLAIRCHTQ